MSHWVVHTVGSLEPELETAWAERHLPKAKWVRRTADRLEGRGDMNPGNAGFVLLQERPDTSDPSRQWGVVLPQSADWCLLEAVDQEIGALRARGIVTGEAAEVLRQDACREIRQAQLQMVPGQIRAFFDAALANGQKPPRP